MYQGHFTIFFFQSDDPLLGIYIISLIKIVGSHGTTTNLIEKKIETTSITNRKLKNKP